MRYLGDLGSSLSIQVVPTKVVRLPMDEEQHPTPPPLYSSILFRIQFLELLGEKKKEMEKKNRRVFFPDWRVSNYNLTTRL